MEVNASLHPADASAASLWFAFELSHGKGLLLMLRGLPVLGLERPAGLPAYTYTSEIGLLATSRKVTMRRTCHELRSGKPGMPLLLAPAAHTMRVIQKHRLKPSCATERRIDANKQESMLVAC